MKQNIATLIFIIPFLICISCQNKKEKHTPEKEWDSLFNGKNLDGWLVKIKGYPLGENYKNTFHANNGILSVSYDEYDKFNANYGHIFFNKPYSNYRFKLEYRFVGNQIKGGATWAKRNSGVMIHSQSPKSMNLNQDFPVSVEVQLLGGLSDGEERPTGNVCTPGTNIEMNHKLITKHCINSTSKTYNGDQWVQLEILVLNDSIIKHFINGKEVIQYSKPQIGGKFNTLISKEGKPLKKGYISLQSESHPVEFRNIELLNLD